MKTGFCYILCMCLFLISGCQKELSDEATNNSYTVHIIFQPVIQGNNLILNKPYVNAFGEDYTVSAFRFYISNLTLQNDQSVLTPLRQETYRLADAEKPGTLTFTITTKQNSFNSISFQIGVDSIDNVSGAQNGDLDPAKGMFWTWNSGYIMAKLEGESSFSSVPDGRYTYHIGGYSGENKTMRSIILPTPGSRQIILKQNRISTVIINADIDQWFQSVHRLTIAENSFVHSPGSLAKLYADNYTNMFNIASIKEE